MVFSGSLFTARVQTRVQIMWYVSVSFALALS